jgi:hypothetical protein|tara:strand:- start:845 stop:1249 length:405 start_codon:yes stop_codon:yes gene_type:complete
MNKYLESEIERISKINLESETGSTFNRDGSKYDEGGLVIPVLSEDVEQDELNLKRVLSFIEKHKYITSGNLGILGENKIKIGLYKFPNKNKVSIDLNFIGDHDSIDLFNLAKQMGQEALYDLDTKQIIKINSSE